MWRRHEKYMNTPCTKMNKAGKGHFWFSLEMSKRGNLLFFLKKVADSWDKRRIALKKGGIHIAKRRIHPKNMNQTHSNMNPPVQKMNQPQFFGWIVAYSFFVLADSYWYVSDSCFLDEAVLLLNESDTFQYESAIKKMNTATSYRNL